MIEKKVGGSTTAPLQTVDYSYNIRDWLTNINKSTNHGADLFRTERTYTEDHVLTDNAQYNGNISGYVWESVHEYTPTVRNYGFAYDGLNRLKLADYVDDDGSTNQDFAVDDLSYDRNGNILLLKRRGKLGSSDQFGLMDDLSYTYSNGNQLKRVHNADNHTYHTDVPEFKDNANASTEYTYDANGNMVTDANKQISDIKYNHLNLSTKVVFSNSQPNVEWTYDVAGMKVKKVYGSEMKWYIGGVEYATKQSGTPELEAIYHEEGRISPNGANWQYEYTIADHLGNARVSFADTDNDGVINENTKILRTQSYYPFGLEMSGLNNPQTAPENLYKLTGKEYEPEIGWSDFGARMYDASIGRWATVDPLAEEFASWTPYHFVHNNPINLIDPDGRAAMSPIYGTDGEFLGTDDQGLQGEAIIMDKADFTQGMSHNDALAKGTTFSDLKGLDRWNFMDKGWEHWQTLDQRPDWDGVVTIDEGIEWAKSHSNLRANPDDTNYQNATADDYLYLDAAKMDFGSLSVSDFKRYNVEQGVNLLDHVNLLSDRSRFTTYALGRTKMTLLSTSGKVQVSNGPWNAYDWDYGGNAIREGLIFGERTLKGLNNTHGFPISVYGTGQLNKK